MVCSHMFLCFSYDFAIQASFKRWISPASHGDDLPEGSSLNPEAIPENQQAQAEVASWDKDSIGLQTEVVSFEQQNCNCRCKKMGCSPRFSQRKIRS